ncbi:MAG: protein-export chaperone SecB [Rhodospirillales bacterium]|nr:protein-export chaperone SecB [Rhodospirillales bacterium]
MTPNDTETGPDTEADTAEAGEQALPPLLINAQYIKDLSFEAPASPGVYTEMQSTQPDISVNIDVNATPLEDNFFEVVLNVSSSCQVGETTAFILELSYGGLFTLNVPPEHLQPMLLIECPRMLFPFARNIVSDTTRDGGFPPVLLNPVDFVGMYQNQLAQQGEGGGGNGGETADA